MEENYNGQPEVLPSKPLFNGRTYDYLKFVALVFLPAAAALYLTLGDLWDFPKVQEVAGTIAAINTLLGALLKVSSGQYFNRDDKSFDGVITIDDSGPKTRVEFQPIFTTDPRDLGKAAMFKVVKK